MQQHGYTDTAALQRKRKKSITSFLSFHQISPTVCLWSFLHPPWVLLLLIIIICWMSIIISLQFSYITLAFILHKKDTSYKEYIYIFSFLGEEHFSVNNARLSDWLTGSSRPVGDGEGGAGGDEEPQSEGETCRKEAWGIEKDISNSKRHAVFPWQLGFHRNGLAKDAISVKKK